MERAHHTDGSSSEYEPPLVEDLETEGDGATVTVLAGPVASGGTFALAEPTDNPPSGSEA